jgi:hypothetical protein
LFPAIFVATSNLSGASDHWLALFIPPLFLCSLRCAQDADARDYLIAGLLSGAALAAKPQSAFFLAACLPLFVYGLVRRAITAKRSGGGKAAAREALRLAGAFFVTSLLFIVPHYGKLWVFYGNPVYPFAQTIFNSSPAVPRAAFLFRELFEDYKYKWHGTTWQNMKSSFFYSWTYSFESPFEGKFAPFLGSMFTLSFPLLPLPATRARSSSPTRWRMRPCSSGRTHGGSTRNMQTFMPLLVAVSAAVIAKASTSGGRPAWASPSS